MRAGLTDGELVFVRFDGVDHLHERFDGEHIVLCRNGAQLFARLGVLVSLFEQGRLIENLACVGEEFRTVHGQRNALGGAGEDLDAELLFQFLDGGAQRGLGHVQLVGGLVHRTAFDDFDDVLQLQKGHKFNL